MNNIGLEVVFWTALSIYLLAKLGAFKKKQLKPMRLQFWYSKGVKQWHWTLHTRHYAPKGQNYYHTSGSGTDVREVMDKVATEVEQLVEEKNNETNTRIN